VAIVYQAVAGCVVAAEPTAAARQASSAVRLSSAEHNATVQVSVYDSKRKTLLIFELRWTFPNSQQQGHTPVGGWAIEAHCHSTAHVLLSKHNQASKLPPKRPVTKNQLSKVWAYHGSFIRLKPPCCVETAELLTLEICAAWHPQHLLLLTTPSVCPACSTPAGLLQPNNAPAGVRCYIQAETVCHSLQGLAAGRPW
jgi:hypothetical protein